MSSADPGTQTFSLRGRPRAIVLEAEGIHHPKTPRGSGFAYTRYEDVTHLASSPRALWIGTRQSVYILARRAFVGEHGPENLVRALLSHIARRPGGAAQVARMAEIEESARTPTSLRATWGLAAACLVLFAVQLWGGEDVHTAGYFSQALTADGDWWRPVTANLIHAYPQVPVHLILNLLGLVAIGTLVERAIGSARSLCVMGASGLAAMGASGLAGYGQVVGVSGVVFGLLGALVWLEFRCADSLPAWWRVPRRGLLWMLAVSAGLPLLVPVIAGAAHLGGFLAGLLITPLLSGRPVGRSSSPGWIRAVGTAVLVVTVSGLGALGYELLRPGEMVARHTARLGRLPGISADELNNTAWVIAIDPESSRERLQAALSLAERAARETDRSEPTILDTLAEVQFQLGNAPDALATIEEAIAQAPDEVYYREQRRRFLGERAPDDRPDSPSPWVTPEPSDPPLDDDGITV